MSNPNKSAEKLKAIQYLFDVARQAPVSAAVHDQCKTYALSLYNDAIAENAAAQAKATPPASVAEAVAAVTGKEITPAENSAQGSAAKPVASTEDLGEPGPGV